MAEVGELNECLSDGEDISEAAVVTAAAPSHKKLQRLDSLDVEAATISGAGRGNTSSMQEGRWRTVIALALQSLGVVYGDLATSPLYVLTSTFTDGVKHPDDILGVLGIVYYTITLIPLVKYILLVLQANDNGDGGTFALYSLICRYTKVGLFPSQQAEDRDVSNFVLNLPNRRSKHASKLKEALENSSFAKYFLLLATMLGTAMVIGDGVLTPCVSVLSAVAGLKEAMDSVTDETIALISIAVLIVLFLSQRFGTDKVGYTFAPIIALWLFSIMMIGIFNFFKYEPLVFKAIYPKYIIDYFMRNGTSAWISLGGCVLCITGVEALFADLGHFSVRSIQLSMSLMVYPALICAYSGQAAYLRKHTGDALNIFYKSIPRPLYWPMFVIAILSAVIASQAMISGTFSIIQQSLALGCFPRVKIVHTSAKYEGQVYVPEVNYILMLACIVVTGIFKNTEKITNAYGTAVVSVMVLTSGFMVLIMVIIWKTHIALILLYIAIIGSIELTYLIATLYKFAAGGYLPLAFAAFIITVMLVWNYAYCKKYMYELQHKVPAERLAEIAADASLQRVPGLALFYSELVQGIPSIFYHYIANVPALHSVLVFVSVKSLPISRVPMEERFLFRRVGPRELIVFRCVVRYGYMEARSEQEPFDVLLVQRLKKFMREEDLLRVLAAQGSESQGDAVMRRVEAAAVAEREVEVVEREWQKRVVHLMGESEVVAMKGSSLWKRLVIDYAYTCLKRKLRQQHEVFTIPRERLLKVGMTIEI